MLLLVLALLTATPNVDHAVPKQIQSELPPDGSISVLDLVLNDIANRCGIVLKPERVAWIEPSRKVLGKQLEADGVAMASRTFDSAVVQYGREDTCRRYREVLEEDGWR